MPAQHVLRSRSVFFRAASLACAASAVLAALLLTASPAGADPLTFSLIDIASNNQSKLSITPTASATFLGAPLTSAAQFPAGGLNGSTGSETSLYKQTTTNTPSNMLAYLHQASIVFPGGGTAQASNGGGGVFNPYPIIPNVGGGNGNAPADYGMVFSSPQNYVLPPVDLSSFGLSATLNLGTLTAINLNVALRDFKVDIQSGEIPLANNGGVLPTHFNANQLQIGISGTADVSLSATLQQADFLSAGAAAIALGALQSTLSGQGVNINVTSNILAKNEQVGIGYSTPVPVTLIANTDANQATIEHSSANFRMVVPIKFDFAPSLPSQLASLITLEFNMQGQLIGTAPFFLVPEPSTWALAVVGFAGILGRGFWRRRRVAAH